VPSFYRLKHPVEQKPDFIEMVEADFMEFFRTNLMVKMHHPIPISRHLPHQLCFVFAQDFLNQQHAGNFLVLRGWKSKPFG
jgi:hypothetical protein